MSNKSLSSYIGELNDAVDSLRILLDITGDS